MNLVKNNLLLLLATFIVFITFSGPLCADDLASLELQLSQVQGQTEMNILSGEIATHWDKELSIWERRLKEVCSGDPDQLAALEISSRSWRDYRDKMVFLAGAYSEGGTIRPLLENSMYAQLTKERVEMILAVFFPIAPNKP